MDLDVMVIYLIFFSKVLSMIFLDSRVYFYLNGKICRNIGFNKAKEICL